MDCIERFQGMRDCFQKHPDVYKDELMDDEEIDAELEREKQEMAQQIAERRKQDVAAEGGGQRRLLEEPASEPRVKATRKIDQQPESVEPKNVATPESQHIHEGNKSDTVKEASPLSVADDLVDTLVPKAAHDARDARV